MRVFLVSAVFLLGACSTTIPVNYNPQTFYKLESGETRIGDFRYIPADEGKVKSNQIKNSAVGSIFIATDVANFVKRATALELERAGIDLNDSSAVEIEGDVLEFRAGDLGYSVQWTYRVTYRIKNGNGTTVFENTYSPPMVKTGKFGRAQDYTPNINELVLAGIEGFINDLKGTEHFTLKTNP